MSDERKERLWKYEETRDAEEADGTFRAKEMGGASANKMAESQAKNTLSGPINHA